MQDKTPEKYSHKATLKEVYAIADEKMQGDLKRLKAIDNSVRIKRITFATFSRVVTIYFTHLLLEIIKEGKAFRMYKRFGYWLAVRTKCVRYTPSHVVWKTVDGKRKPERKKLRVWHNTGGYVPFIFWDAPAKWRHYRLRMNLKWKRILFKEFKNGKEYVDYTLQKHGANASDTYIRV